MIDVLLLGGHGYIGSQFKIECAARGLEVYSPQRESYYDPKSLRLLVELEKPKLVINAAAYVPAESVSLCDRNPSETLRANLMLPAMVSLVCHQHDLPFAHISTGCLWSDGMAHSEEDVPQRAFNGHCGFYIGSKVMAEEAVRHHSGKHYIWRIRLPFDGQDHPRNYLSKLARFSEVWDHENTLSHRGDFVKACLDLWQMQADWGTYHVMNPGTIKASEVLRRLLEKEIRKLTFNPPVVTPGPQAGAICRTDKLIRAGVKMRNVAEALEDSVNHWTTLV